MMFTRAVPLLSVRFRDVVPLPKVRPDPEIVTRIWAFCGPPVRVIVTCVARLPVLVKFSGIGETLNVPSQTGFPLAATAGDATATAIAGTDHAAPFSRVRRLAPPSAGRFFALSKDIETPISYAGAD